ncbi:hypothetical protein LX87_01730 [Larkinella arboricola]|uniref:Uncharacterized protein n=2 Tax=Larkinella arboricola TaxID=643671 RepID=A0A327X4N0_LARAB|nr:hypothetical protein LX87_01730 [Larkinella arboricola]
MNRATEASNKLSDAIGISTLEGKHEYYGAPLLSARTVDLKTGQVTNGPREMISQNALEQGKTYEWESVGMLDQGVPAKMAVTLDINQVSQKYPSLSFKQGAMPIAPTEYDIVLESDGLLSYKNARCYLTTNQLSLMTEANLGKLGVSTATQPLRKEEAVQQLPKMLPTHVKVLELPNVLLGLVAGLDENDKWSENKQFKLIQFDPTGKVLKKTDLTFEFVRNVAFADVVRDRDGQPKGALYIFSGLLSTAGKKHRDPVENRFNVVYVGLDGDVQYRYDLEYGDPDNRRGLNPILALEENGQVNLLSVNLNKNLKPVIEKITLNEKGKVAAVPVTMPLKGNSMDYFIGMNPNRQLTRINGNICYITQKAESHETPSPTGIGKLTTWTYGPVHVLLLKPDFSLLSAGMIPLAPSASPAQIEAIPSADGAPRLLVTTAHGNQFVTLSETPVVTNVTPKGGIVPATMTQRPNYVWNASEQKYIFVYETTKLGEARLVEVSL